MITKLIRKVLKNVARFSLDVKKERKKDRKVETSSKKNMIIYRDHLLAPSETFIKYQAEGLQDFHSYFVGSRAIKGLDIDPNRKFLINRGDMIGRLKEILFKLTGSNKALIKQLALLKPQLIHAHFGPDGVLAMPLADQLQVPLIVTFHGYDATTKDHYAEKSYFTHRNYLHNREELQRKGDLFLAVSDFIKQKMIDQGFPAEKIIRHYIGVDTQAFTPDLTIQRKPYVLFVGRLVEVKGCEYLIRAMQIVQQTHPELELVVIGDGPLRQKLQQLAAQVLVKYRFLLTQPKSEVKRWMNSSTLLCVPSITAASGAEEGLGMVFLEASAMGLPVVSFATGGIPEAVKHGETGFLAKEKDWKELGNYITRLTNDKALWQSFSAAGQRRTRESFDLNEQTRKIERLYGSLLMEMEQSQPLNTYAFHLS